jgi:hypothetical protein
MWIAGIHNMTFIYYKKMYLGYDSGRLSIDLLWIDFHTMIWCRGTWKYLVINAVYYYVPYRFYF